MTEFVDLVTDNRKLAIGGGLSVVIAFIFPRLFPVVMLGASFLGGLLACHRTFSPTKAWPNLIAAHTRKKATKRDDELTLTKKICPVCGKELCNRHRPELNVLALQPWTGIHIPQKIDLALEEFLNLVLKEYIYAWYRELSEEEAFVDEIRSSLRFIVSVLIRRIEKTDIPTLITGKVLKTAIRHLHIYLEARAKARPGVDLQHAVLEHYGSHLHVALRNRRSELDYLRYMSERLFPYILPLQSLKCKSLCVLLREILAGAILLPAMDVIADPDTVNNLLLIILDKEPPPDCHDPPSQLVPVLGVFSQPLSKPHSCFHLELKDVLTNNALLFPFMQFMKSEASINVLQFYLSVDEFNKKMLMPELSPKQLSALHADLSDLYRMYCDPEATDCIQFDSDIITQLKLICDGPPEGVIKLQTSTPLFRAYEHAYDLLENTFLPLFHRSDDYYKLLCGERLSTGLKRSFSRTGKRAGDSIGLSRIGSKIKGVFKTNTVEGKLPEDVDYGAEETDANSMGDTIVGMLPCRMWEAGPLRDLSAWRVTVPNILAKPELENPRRYYQTFSIDVRRVDVLEDDFEASNWRVERRYAEFYVLEQKLTEFHGELEAAQLPPKKSFGTKKREFLESVRPVFEQYLQKLLTMPILRGSELLHSFLTSECEFTTGFLPDINLGKIVKSGAMKFVKEKGQHLDPFLQSFLSSTESSKPRPCRWNDRDSDTVSISSEKMASSLYENNANQDLSSVTSHLPDSYPLLHVPVEGIYDTIVYLVEKVYGAPQWLNCVLMMGRVVARNTLDAYVDWFLGHKLDSVLQEHRAIKIITLLKDTLFFPDPPRTDEDKLERRQEALNLLKDTIPGVFSQAVGKERYNIGTDMVFEVLQHPQLNKQLSYMLLDELLAELFPDILSEMESDPYVGIFRHIS